jgi:hypothetical protein
LAAGTAAAATLTLDNPNLLGQPGDIVGWGFTLSNSPDWIVISNAVFDLNLGSNSIGVFTPFITNNFVVIGPDDGNGELDPWMQSFDDNLQTGIGSYAINSFQSPGDSAVGNIVLTYDEFSVSPNDPSFDPTIDTVANGLTVSAPASVSVPPQASVPEPGSLLLALACAALLLAKAASHAARLRARLRN